MDILHSRQNPFEEHLKPTKDTKPPFARLQCQSNTFVDSLELPNEERHVAAAACMPATTERTFTRSCPCRTIKREGLATSFQPRLVLALRSIGLSSVLVRLGLQSHRYRPCWRHSYEFGRPYCEYFRLFGAVSQLLTCLKGWPDCLILLR